MILQLPSTSLSDVRPGIQSEDQNHFFTFKVRTFWQSEVKISVLALRLGALSSFLYGCRGVWTLSSLCTCQARSEVCEKMSSLWMCYTQICPRFEWRDERTIHTCVYCVLTLNAGTGRGELLGLSPSHCLAHVMFICVFAPASVLQLLGCMRQIERNLLSR